MSVKKQTLILLVVTCMALVIALCMPRLGVTKQLKKWGMTNQANGVNNQYTTVLTGYHAEKIALDGKASITQRINITPEIKKDENLVVAFFLEKNIDSESDSFFIIEVSQNGNALQAVWNTKDILDSQEIGATFSTAELQEGLADINVYTVGMEGDSHIDVDYWVRTKDDEYVHDLSEYRELDFENGIFREAYYNGERFEYPLRVRIYTF